jgi:hypothetical protein
MVRTIGACHEELLTWLIEEIMKSGFGAPPSPRRKSSGPTAKKTLYLA